jgi:hypothetical protein
MNRIAHDEHAGIEEKFIVANPDQSCKSCQKTKGAIKI